jgi:prepilin-type N-terminal cleavage/methylation domain-containing protein
MRRQPRRRAAFSMIELMVALALLATVLLGFGGAVSTTSSQRLMADERRRAETELSSYLQSLRGLTLVQVMAEPTSGTVTVDGLRGTVTRTLTTFPDEAGDSTDPDSVALGFPLDLNADGDDDDGTVAATELFMLPVKLTLSYTSVVQDTGEAAAGTAPRTTEIVLYAYLSNF